ncbi:MAG: hypothetical protein LBG78_05830 [Azoarcus sp.]|jgi:hypothetical protein|nr:hypothetical protein [Azoarcus sp.]
MKKIDPLGSPAVFEPSDALRDAVLKDAQTLEQAQATRREAIRHLLARGGSAEEALDAPVSAQTEAWLKQTWMLQPSVSNGAARPKSHFFFRWRAGMALAVSACLALLIWGLIPPNEFPDWGGAVPEQEMPLAALEPAPEESEAALAEPPVPAPKYLAPDVTHRTQPVLPPPPRAVQPSREPARMQKERALSKRHRAGHAAQADMLADEKRAGQNTTEMPSAEFTFAPAPTLTPAPAPAIAPATVPPQAASLSEASPEPLPRMQAEALPARSSMDSGISPVPSPSFLYPVGAEQWKRVAALVAKSPVRSWRLLANEPDEKGIQALAASLRTALPSGATITIQADSSISSGYARLVAVEP